MLGLRYSHAVKQAIPKKQQSYINSDIILANVRHNFWDLKKFFHAIDQQSILQKSDIARSAIAEIDTSW